MDSDQLNICTALPLRRVNNIKLFVNALCVILSHCITLLKTLVCKVSYFIRISGEAICLRYRFLSVRLI